MILIWHFYSSQKKLQLSVNREDAFQVIRKVVWDISRNQKCENTSPNDPNKDKAIVWLVAVHN